MLGREHAAPVAEFKRTSLANSPKRSTSCFRSRARRSDHIDRLPETQSDHLSSFARRSSKFRCSRCSYSSLTKACPSPASKNKRNQEQGSPVSWLRCSRQRSPPSAIARCVFPVPIRSGNDHVLGLLQTPGVRGQREPPAWAVTSRWADPGGRHNARAPLRAAQNSWGRKGQPSPKPPPSGLPLSSDR